MIKKKVLARIKSIPFLIKQAAPYYKVQFRTNNILVKIYSDISNSQAVAPAFIIRHCFENVFYIYRSKHRDIS